MQQIKKAAAGLLARLTGNDVGQATLARIVFYANYLMGIGAGAHASSSGEVGILRSLYAYGKAPFTILDVGANQGQFLRLALRETDAAVTQIHCFEPSMTAFAILSEAFADSGNVRLNNFGLGASKGEAILYFDEPGSGLASLTQRRLDHFGISHDRSESVILETVDAYCEVGGIDEITLLKIDVEGHELDVLRGASSMFAKRSIGAATFEFGGCNIDTRTFFQDYWYFFRDAGMKLYRVTPSGYLYPIQAYREAMEQMVTTNFVAIR